MKDAEDKTQNGEGLTEGKLGSRGNVKLTNLVSRLAHPKKLNYSTFKDKEESKLKSSPPPMTPEQLAPKVKEHKELIDYMSKHEDLPIGWPLCTFDEGVSRALHSTNPTYLGKMDPCPEPAAWIVQLDYYNPNSKKAYLCTPHFTQLPVQPIGSMYRVFKLTVNNYKRELNEMVNQAQKEEEKD